jgi:hypothetical protein
MAAPVQKIGFILITNLLLFPYFRDQAQLSWSQTISSQLEDPPSPPPPPPQAGRTRATSRMLKTTNPLTVKGNTSFHGNSWVSEELKGLYHPLNRTLSRGF